MSLMDSAVAMHTLIAQLLQQHRAGITPHFGQLEELADLNTRLGADIDGIRAAPAVPRISHDAVVRTVTQQVLARVPELIEDAVVAVLR